MNAVEISVTAEVDVERRLMTGAQVCQLLQISRTTLARMIRDNEIKYVQVRGRKRFDGASLDRLLGTPQEAHETTGGELR